MSPIASEARYRSFFTATNQEIHCWRVIRDSEGEIVNWVLEEANPAALTSWGKKLDEIRGKNPNEIFGDGTRDDYKEVVRKIMKERSSYSHIDYFAPLDRYFHVTLTPLETEFVVYATDITEVRRTQRLAEEQSAKLEAIFQSVSEGISVFDMKGRCIMANEAHREIFGYECLEVGGLEEEFKIYKIQNAAGQLLPLEAWPVSKVLQGRIVESWVLRVRRADSTQESFVSFSGRPIFDSEGNQTLAVIISRDISAQRIAEDALIKSEEHFRSLANLIPQHAWISDTEGHLTWCNRRFEEHTEQASAVSENTGQVKKVAGVQVFNQAWLEAIKKGLPFEITLPLKDRNGKERWFLTRANPIRSADGIPTLWLGTNTDIDEQKRLTEKLALALDARDEFLSIASHELKTPLSTLKLQAQQARREFQQSALNVGDKERILKLIEQTDRQADRLTRLVDDMMDVSRIRSGKLSIIPQKCSLSEVLGEIVERMEAALTRRPALFEVSCEKEIQGYWDRVRLEQVLTNLLSNALRYGNKKPVQVKLSRDKDLAQIAVRDNGAGILKEDLERIFARYERGVSVGDIAGLGLGLFISKQIIEVHGGRIWAESAGLGKGSTFYVEIPLDSRARS